VGLCHCEGPGLDGLKIRTSKKGSTGALLSLVSFHPPSPSIDVAVGPASAADPTPDRKLIFMRIGCRPNPGSPTAIELIAGYKNCSGFCDSGLVYTGN
jgi:hypothetical protein